MTDLTIGTRIYNHGDQANVPHFGAIVSIVGRGAGLAYTIATDGDDAGLGPDAYTYTVPASMISVEFLGHSGTRIVTVDAYNAYKADQLARLEAAIPAKTKTHTFDQMIVTESDDPTKQPEVEITSCALADDLGEDYSVEYESSEEAYDALLGAETDLRRAATRLRQDIEDAQRALNHVCKSQARVNEAKNDLELFL